MELSPSVRVRFLAERACFAREKKDEPVSYPAPTPSAARAMLEAVLWKPAIFWHVRRIHIINPISWFTVRTNEVKNRFDPGRVIVIEDDRTQRKLLGLRDVDYVVEAQFSFTPKRGERDTTEKFLEMLEKRVALGQCRFQPYFGKRDFPGFFENAPDPIPVPEELAGRSIDLGMMLLDRHYGPDITPEFFHAEIKNGVLVEYGKDALPLFQPWVATED